MLMNEYIRHSTNNLKKKIYKNMAINYNKIYTNKYTNHIGKDDVTMISFFDPADFLVSEARTESNL